MKFSRIAEYEQPSWEAAQLKAKLLRSANPDCMVRVTVRRITRNLPRAYFVRVYERIES